MGTVLWSPTWPVGERFSVRRSYTTVIVVGWTDSVIVEAGNPTIQQETIFGGFRFHLEFKDYFWQWSSSSYLLQDIFENVYVTFPFSSDPISVGPVNVRYGFVPELQHFGIILDMGGAEPSYWAQEMPAQPPDFWLPPRPALPPMPYNYVG
jgi:hypothetical protein